MIGVRVNVSERSLVSNFKDHLTQTGDVTHSLARDQMAIRDSKEKGTTT